VSTKVEYDQNRRDTVAIHGNQSSQTPARTSAHSAATTGVVINEQLYPCTAAPPGTISNLPGHARRVYLCRQHPHPSNNTSNSPPSTPKRLPLQSTASNCTHALPANSDSDLRTYKGSLPSADYTLVHQIQPPQHFHPRRRDCLCSRQRAAPHSKYSSQHGPPPTRLPASLLPTSGNPRAARRTDCTLENQHKPLQLFPLLRSDCQCSHQRETANPVRNPASFQTSGDVRRVCLCRLPLAHQQAASKKKEILQVKSIQGWCPGRETGESAREDVNRSPTGRRPQEKKVLHAGGKEHPRVMPKLEFRRVCQGRHQQKTDKGRHAQERMKVRGKMLESSKGDAQLGNLRSLPRKTSTGTSHRTALSGTDGAMRKKRSAHKDLDWRVCHCRHQQPSTLAPMAYRHALEGSPEESAGTDINRSHPRTPAKR
jgi:hypothetical protein